MTVKLKGSNIPRFILESIFVILFIIELFIRWASLKRQGSSCRIVSCSMVCNQEGSCIRPLKTRLVEYYCSGLVTHTHTHTHTPTHLFTFGHSRRSTFFQDGWNVCDVIAESLDLQLHKQPTFDLTKSITFCLDLQYFPDLLRAPASSCWPLALTASC